MYITLQGEVFSTQNILWIISPSSGIRNFSSLLTQRKLLSRNTFCPKEKEVYLRRPLGREFWMRIGSWFPFCFVLFFGSINDILWKRTYLLTKLFEVLLKKVHGSSPRLTLSNFFPFEVTRKIFKVNCFYVKPLNFFKFTCKGLTNLCRFTANGWPHWEPLTSRL